MSVTIHRGTARLGDFAPSRCGRQIQMPDLETWQLQRSAAVIGPRVRGDVREHSKVSCLDARQRTRSSKDTPSGGERPFNRNRS